MPPKLLVDLDQVDLKHSMYTVEQIEAVNPQRGDMRQLDGICAHDEGCTWAVGYKDVGDDEFWVAGHIPGRPLYPGVLMIEAAAQLAAFMMKKRLPTAAFIGFVGCDQVKFRTQVKPGDRLYLLGREVKFTSRRLICQCQAVVRGALAFEATITGMPI